MLPRDHGHSVLREDEVSRPIQGMLKQGPGADEGTVLVGFQAPQPLLNQGPHGPSLAACQNNRPQLFLPHHCAHELLLNPDEPPPLDGSARFPSQAVAGLFLRRRLSRITRSRLCS